MRQRGLPHHEETAPGVKALDQDRAVGLADGRGRAPLEQLGRDRCRRVPDAVAAVTAELLERGVPSALQEADGAILIQSFHPGRRLLVVGEAALAHALTRRRRCSGGMRNSQDRCRPPGARSRSCRRATPSSSCRMIRSSTRRPWPRPCAAASATSGRWDRGGHRRAEPRRSQPSVSATPRLAASTDRSGSTWPQPLRPSRRSRSARRFSRRPRAARRVPCATALARSTADGTAVCRVRCASLA